MKKWVRYLLLAGVFLIPLISYWVTYVVKTLSWENNVSGYLRRASVANTVEIALVDLKKAVKYLEDNGITEGNTGVLWKSPSRDIGYWYNNLKASEIQLELVSLPKGTSLGFGRKIEKDASREERELVLLRLKQTLLEDRKESIVQPSGVEFHPNFVFFFFFMNFSFVCLFLAFLFAIMAFCCWVDDESHYVRRG